MFTREILFDLALLVDVLYLQREASFIEALHLKNTMKSIKTSENSIWERHFHFR